MLLASDALFDGVPLLIVPTLQAPSRPEESCTRQGFVLCRLAKVTETVIQDNMNPIENVERSVLIMATRMQHVVLAPRWCHQHRVFTVVIQIVIIPAREVQ